MAENLSLSHRASGVLLHPTSLPGPHGIGDLGLEAYRFADFLYEAGQSWWQMFPLGPLGIGNSPYQTLSAFAGNPLLISLELLVEEGLLKANDIRPRPALKSNRVDYRAVRSFKAPLFRKAFIEFQRLKRHKKGSEFDSFCTRNADWLSDYTFFCALKKKHRGVSWVEWEPEARSGKASVLARLLKSLQEDIHYCQFLQYQFFRQWTALKDYCNKKDVGLIGDIPIFIAHDSADVWANPGLFWLGPDGRPTVVAGVPPDYFSKKGQLWGNPLYRWAVLKERGYDWWIHRFKTSFERFDAVRLDHFIGFTRYWEVPAKSLTAERGRWVQGPGAGFFKKVLGALGPLELIAEDLGVVTPEVVALREQFNFPGLKVLQFAFGGGADAQCFLPHCHVRRCVVYTGTHDNDTTVGWFKGRSSKFSTRSRQQIEKERRIALAYMSTPGREVHWDLIRLAMMSVADTLIIPTQDILGLGSEARMNRPGTVEGNWEWRMHRSALTTSVTKRLHDMTRIYCRLPARNTKSK
ncbi:MAG: 4-alpha-glucanotransferase [Elusimicrobia bacterium]|nr:4-alpha-glucanotransferase [Candidatus Obscuribacterium magneticum]